MTVCVSLLKWKRERKVKRDEKKRKGRKRGRRLGRKGMEVGWPESAPGLGGH